MFGTMFGSIVREEGNGVPTSATAPCPLKRDPVHNCCSFYLCHPGICEQSGKRSSDGQADYSANGLLANLGSTDKK